jgi:hypothetical protein
MFPKFLALLLGLPVFLQAAEPQRLFNGKDFEGWTFENIDPKVNPASIWSIDGGMIVCKGRPPGLIRTAKDFSNYELVVEWRWAPDTKPENSGILIHASKSKEIYVWPKSIEIQLGHTNAGDFWVIGETLKVAGIKPDGRRWVKKGDSAEKPPGEWNTAKVRCAGDKASVWINGTLMNEATGLSATKGAICLQAEGGEIHFRKVELTPVE